MSFAMIGPVGRCLPLLAQCQQCGGGEKCRECRGWSELERHYYALGKMHGCAVCRDTMRCRGCKGTGKKGE